MALSTVIPSSFDKRLQKQGAVIGSLMFTLVSVREREGFNKNFFLRYIAQNPDAERKEEEYESWEQRELRQIFVGQSQVCGVFLVMVTIIE